MNFFISSRITSRPNVAISLGILLATFALSGCGNDSAVAPTASASTSASPAPTQSSAVDELQDYTFYLLADTAQGFRLVREVHQVSKLENDLGDDKGLNSLLMLVNGQLPPYDRDHVTLWENGTQVNSVTTVDGLATVDLSLGRISYGSESELRAIDQITWTLIENDSSISSVQFTIDGKPAESLAGHVNLTQPFTQAPGYEVLASVWIDLLDRSDVQNPVSITGSACTFEANVAWELTQNGDVVDSGATTAALACPDRSDWKIELGDLALGNYVLTVSDFSAEDGSPIFQDTKAFTVID